ncbi:MAG TPA: hypothetical protein VMF56_01635 [Acidobacteriaceae bacterium]|nr:hypothetical protein [Acidobacteriaceae bacterium]
MKLRIVSGCLLAMVSCCTLVSAQSAFVGKWKLNQAKSHLTGDTVTYSTASDGMLKETTGVGSYTFKTDGQPYKTPFDSSVTWKQTGPSTWTTEDRHGDMLLDTDVMQVSKDGKTMTVISTGTNPDGTAFHDTEVYTRTAGTNGLLGTWKSEKVKESTSPIMEFAANGPNGIAWILPEIKARLDLTFDGKDVTPVGPTVPAGLTLAATKINAQSFSFVEKMNGKPIVKGTLTVSHDGKTLTNTSSAMHEQNKRMAVYDKE